MKQFHGMVQPFADFISCIRDELLTCLEFLVCLGRNINTSAQFANLLVENHTNIWWYELEKRFISWGFAYDVSSRPSLKKVYPTLSLDELVQIKRYIQPCPWTNWCKLRFILQLRFIQPCLRTNWCISGSTNLVFGRIGAITSCTGFIFCIIPAQEGQQPLLCIDNR